MTSIPLHTFGQTDVALSALSLGTVKFGRNAGVKYPTAFELPSDNQLQTLLAYAHDCGISSLDTAPAYGVSEQRLGQLLKNKRQQFQLISKAGEVFSTETLQSHYRFDAHFLRSSLEHSLTQLKTDYLDVWLLHSDGNDLVNLTDEAIYTLLKAKQDGLVRSVGASTKTVEGGRYALRYLDGIMMAASLQNTEENALFAIAQQENKGIILKKIFDSGWALHGDNKTQVMQQTFKQLFSYPQVTSAVIGTTTMAHLQENINAWLAR